MLVALALASGTMLAWPLVQQRRGGGGAIGTAEAVRLINREKGVLIDIGEPAEYAAGHAVGARNVPLAQLPTKDAAAAVKGLPTNKALPVLVLCATGARSGRAAAQLRAAGYERAAAVAGGNAAWREAQLPMERSAT